MIRAWRNEIVCVLALAAALLLPGLLLGNFRLPFLLGFLGYLGWHLFNFLLLQTWIARRRSFRLPVSLGVWEAVFDGLQRGQLRKRRRDRRLIASLSDYRQAAASLPDALVVMSEGGRIRWFNPAARKLLGLNWPEDLERDLSGLLRHPVLEDDLAGGRPSRPLEVPSPINGALMLSVQVTAPFGNQRERLLQARDITSVFRLEQVRRDFLANASHELRTPITVFRGYLEALREAFSGDPEWQRPLAQMDQQAQRMQDLVGDLLELSRLEMAGRLDADAPVPIPEMLSEIVEEARALRREPRHDLRLRADPSAWLLGEEAELRSAFSNIIFNAVRHTRPGTRVEIEWRTDGEGASFSVRDHGQGIAAYHLPRLSERFYRVDAGRSRDSGGTGLGLAIVKQVLDRYSAELKIASEVGVGSTFICQFPESLVQLAPPADLPKAG